MLQAISLGPGQCVQLTVDGMLNAAQLVTWLTGKDHQEACELLRSMEGGFGCFNVTQTPEGPIVRRVLSPPDAVRLILTLPCELVPQEKFMRSLTVLGWYTRGDTSNVVELQHECAPQYQEELDSSVILMDSSQEEPDMRTFTIDSSSEEPGHTRQETPDRRSSARLASPEAQEPDSTNDTLEQNDPAYTEQDPGNAGITIEQEPYPEEESEYEYARRFAAELQHERAKLALKRESYQLEQDHHRALARLIMDRRQFAAHSPGQITVHSTYRKHCTQQPFMNLTAQGEARLLQDAGRLVLLEYLGQFLAKPARVTEGARTGVPAYPESFEPEIVRALHETFARSFSDVREILAFQQPGEYQ